LVESKSVVVNDEIPAAPVAAESQAAEDVPAADVSVNSENIPE
jgi:hypothetical protein